jgi:CheY-like chemotaxis protein
VEPIRQVSLEGGQERRGHNFEDEVLLRLDLSKQLRKAGFNVIEADTGDEALRLLATESNVDIILTDIRMPGRTDGMDL